MRDSVSIAHFTGSSNRRAVTDTPRRYVHPASPPIAMQSLTRDAPFRGKAAGTEDLEAYAGGVRWAGYIRGLALSTTWGACFITLKKEVPLRHRLHNDGLTGQSLP